MTPARFVTDTSLDLLARRLRVLGFDVLTRPDSRLEELFSVALLDGRVVLTSSQRHPRRFAPVTSIVVPREDPAAAVRIVAARHQPAGPPFSRCPRCNHELERGDLAAAAGRVPPAVLEESRSLRRCPSCAQWYWPGSHVDRLREWLAKALGRPVPGPEP